MNAYKVCSISKYSGYQSWVNWNCWKPVSYDIDKMAYRPEGFGPLTAFKTLRQALQFLGDKNTSETDCAILYCEYEPATDIGFDEVALWTCNSEGKKIKGTWYDDLPVGTVLCDAIKPIRLVVEYMDGYKYGEVTDDERVVLDNVLNYCYNSNS